MVVQTNELDICAGRYVDIPLELWLDVHLKIKNIRVISRVFVGPSSLSKTNYHWIRDDWKISSAW